MRPSNEPGLEDTQFLEKLLQDLDLLDAEVRPGSDVAGAAGGVAVGGAAAFGALYGLGTTGLGSVGITSGLAAAGALVGGGLAAGVGVLAAPVAVLGAAGYAVVRSRRQQRVARLQRACLAKAVSKQSDILLRLEQSPHLSPETVQELRTRNTSLATMIRRLQKHVVAGYRRPPALCESP